MLIDNGSELTFISEKLAKQLKLHRDNAAIPIIGIAGTHSGTTKGAVNCTLYSVNSDHSITVKAFILPKLMPILPSFTLTGLHWSHLDGLQLADPDFLSPRAIDFILGADSYPQFIRPEIRMGADGSPMAQNSVFWWFVLGPITNRISFSGFTHQVSVDREFREIQDLLTRFWEQEEAPNSPALQFTPEEQDCESHFVRTHSRDSTGRYVVRLPLLSSTSRLGDSYGRAAQSLQGLLRRLSRDASYQKLYSEFLREYEEHSHMERVSSALSQDSRVHYLPHHGVWKESSNMTKLRVVFNGSRATGSGVSLNDILHTGAKLQRDISDVLLWVRRHRYVFVTDTAKMFRQIRVHRDDQDLQRILWVDSHGNIIRYRLTTVTYGTRPAPFVAVRVLLQWVNDEGEKYPEAVAPLTMGRYMDDIFGGADQYSDLISQAHQLIGICKAGGFPLSKWQSSHPELLNALGVNISSEDSQSFKDCESKVLGLTWVPATDAFKFTTLSFSSGNKITKRVILSEIAQLYDPLGFLAPVVIRAKITLQNLWLEKLGWDDEVSSRVRDVWISFRQELTDLGNLSVPRWIQLAPSSSVELHGFSDASQLAMGAVVYVRVSRPGLATRVAMVCSKTKVAPIKRLTIPRLELSAALLLAKLARSVQDTLKLTDSPVFLWTDSTVTLNWVTSHPSRWKDFVRNRVSSAQELLPSGQWRFIPGRDSRADCVSRGLTVSQLERHTPWWDGPHWSTKSHLHWPSHIIGADASAALEERPGLTLTVSAGSSSPELWDLIHRYSSLIRLLRITSLCFKVFTTLRKQNQGRPGSQISPGDLEHSRLFWAKATKGTHFSLELKLLSSGQALPKSYPITRLTGFLDATGVLRVGGRLKHSALQPESKHAVILPRDSGLTRLLIADAHQRTYHGGTQSTLAYLRTHYWIIGGRAPIRSHILRCVKCARQRGIRAQQLMGQLPLTRATPSRAFLYTGEDYAGPVSLKLGRGQGSRTHKGWLCIFVCFSTSALHLEVVSDLTSEAFIAAFRRFTGRRGICHTLYSDNGTNFQGADAKLRRLFISGTRESDTTARILANDGTHWVFNPPGAPLMGGKWEAAVKSVKYHLRRTIGETALTFEEFTTLITQIEAVLNSCPLEPLSDDPEDLSALTPGHFLIGGLLTTIPEPSLGEVNTARLSRWQLIQERLQYFWDRWSTGYLQRQQAISNWHHPSHEIRVGSVALLTDEKTSPTKWPLVRVLVLHPGQDGLTRVVTIKTATSTLKRPIAKLALLPISSGSQ